MLQEGQLTLHPNPNPYPKPYPHPNPIPDPNPSPNPNPDPNPKPNPTVLQEGVIGIPPPKALGLCAGMTNAPYATTTEVYPDSPQADGAQCNAAQVDP